MRFMERHKNNNDIVMPVRENCKTAQKYSKVTPGKHVVHTQSGQKLDGVKCSTPGGTDPAIHTIVKKRSLWVPDGECFDESTVKPRRFTELGIPMILFLSWACW